MIKISLPPGKKVYFCSDNHLGAPDHAASRPRELKFVSWLDDVQEDAIAIIHLGDLFDFWFEYEKVVPKGFTRTMGKLAGITDRGIPVYFFVGNHDLWMKDYFEKELGITVFRKPQHFQIQGKHFLIAHGDGLGPGDKGYKRMKKLFTNPLAKWLFKWLHPDLGVRLGHYFSVKNKLISGKEDVNYDGPENEWLYHYAKRKMESENFDFFVFGHRHLPLEIPIGEQAIYFNLGDWITHDTYGVFDGNSFELKKFDP